MNQKLAPRKKSEQAQIDLLIEYMIRGTFNINAGSLDEWALANRLMSRGFIAGDRAEIGAGFGMAPIKKEGARTNYDLITQWYVTEKGKSWLQNRK